MGVESRRGNPPRRPVVFVQHPCGLQADVVGGTALTPAGYRPGVPGRRPRRPVPAPTRSQPHDRPATTAVTTGAGRPGTRTHRAWLARERERLWAFGHRSVSADGGFRLVGRHREDHGRPYIQGLDHLSDDPCRGARAARRTRRGLAGPRPRSTRSSPRSATPTTEAGMPRWGRRGRSPPTSAPEHAFVLLATASAQAAGHARGVRPAR